MKNQQGSSPMTFTNNAANRIVTMLQGAATTSYTYDNTGNLTAENNTGVITNYSYDNENRLTKVSYSDGTISTYTYQGLDGLRRTAQEPGKTVHTMIWAGSDYLGELQ